MRLNCLKAKEPLRGDSLLFTETFPGVSSSGLKDMMGYPKHVPKKVKKNLVFGIYFKLRSAQNY